MSVTEFVLKLKELNINIKLVGNDLKIKAPDKVLTNDIINEIKIKKEGIINFLKLTSVLKNYNFIIPAEKKPFYKLSSTQRRLFFLQEYNPNTTAYNILQTRVIGKGLDFMRIKKAFEKLIQRHESLRTSIQLKDGEPVQVIHDIVNFKIEYFIESDDIKIKKITDQFVRPFDLKKPCFLRICIIQKSVNRYILLRDIHHIISDITSQEILNRDLQHFLLGKQLSPLRLQYKDFAEWQQSAVTQKALENQKKYWLKQFEGELPVLDLPYDYPRPALQSFEGATIEFGIGKEEADTLKKIAREEGATLFMVMLSCFNILLSKLSGQEDIIIGTPIAGRSHPDLNEIVGMFVNTLALRNYPKGEKSFRDFLRELRDKCLENFEYQDYAFEGLVEHVVQERDLSRNPLFDVMLVLQHIDTFNSQKKKENQSSGIDTENYLERVSSSKFDLTLHCIESTEGIYCNFEYSTKLFDRVTIKRYINYFKTLIKTIIQNPEELLQEVNILPDTELVTLLETFNTTQTDYPRDKTIIDLFEEQVERTPDNIAVVYEDEKLTYKELNACSTQLGRLLRKKGVGPESIVGLMVDRSIEMIVGMLGILKAGGAYLPLDPTYPEKRISYMLKDSGTNIVVVDKSYEQIEKSIEVLEIIEGLFNEESDLNLERINTSRSLIYVIYTSGSTGKPKGVTIEHRSVINLAISQLDTFKINQKDRILQFSSICFDASVEQIWIAFLSGARLVLINKEKILNNEHFEVFLHKNKVTHLHTVPNFLLTLHLREPGSLKRVVVSGDKCSSLLVLKFSKWNNIEFYNKYGLTETSVTSTVYRFFYLKEKEKIISIGSPLSNTQIYILDSNMQIVPISVQGELCISGDGLARGYLNNEVLTRERFIANPFGEGRLCKTGDIARWLPDGNIEFLGRKDDQVKIRGYRIELGEIEKILLKSSGIKDVVVIVKGQEDNKYLCTYYTSDVNISLSELRDHVSRYLPEYMIPGHFIQLEKIPLTSSGKVDKHSLPTPEFTSSENYVAPINQTEQRLVSLWSEILNLPEEKISTTSDFFELGGHSLKSMMLMGKINSEFNVNIPLIEIYKNATVSKLAKTIKKQTEVHSHFNEHIVTLKLSNNKNSKNIFLIHDGLGEIEYYMELIKTSNDDFSYYGIKSTSLKKTYPYDVTIEELSKKYLNSIKSVQSTGPYNIVGWSFGGLLAFEITRQLEVLGDNVGFLGLIDSFISGNGLLKQSQMFNVETEIKWLNCLIKNNKIINELRRENNLAQFWEMVINHIDFNDFDIKQVKNMILSRTRLRISNYEKMSIKKLFSYINFGRSLKKARYEYNPINKINADIFYIKASNSAANSYWSDLTNSSFRVDEIEGDHYSIMKLPVVKKISDIIQNNI